MANIREFANVDIELRTATTAVPGFDTLFLGCDYSTGLGSIPIDTRYLIVTKDSFTDDLTADTEEYNFASIYFSQKRTPSQLIIGRLVREDSSPYTVLSGGTQAYSAYTGVTDGKLKFIDNSTVPLVQEVAIPTLASCTSFADVLTVINGALDALETPNIAHLDDCRFALDSLGRLYFSIPSIVGAAGKTIALTAASGATDLFANAYLGGTQTVYAGMDDETVEAGLQAVVAAIGSAASPYDVAVFRDFDGSGNRQMGEDELEDLSDYIQTQYMQCTLVSVDANCVSGSSTDDLAYNVNATANKRTMVIYTEKEDEYPDAAILGCIYPAKEGTTNFAFEVLSGVTESGSPALSVSEKAILRAKYCNYIETVGSNTFLYPGINSGNEEKRIMLGRDWLKFNIDSDLFTSMLNEPIHVFDLPTFAIVEAIIRKWCKEAANRKIIYPLDDKDYPLTITMPAPSDFSAAEKKSHEFDRTEIFKCYILSAINKYSITGVMSI